MSRQASWTSAVSGKIRGFSGVLPIRLALLFVASVLLAFFLAEGNATADRLFQSPESPPPAVEPAAQPPAEAAPQPVEQAPAPASPVEQAVPQEQPSLEQAPAEQPQPEIPAFEDPLAQPDEMQAVEQPLLEPEGDQSPDPFLDAEDPGRFEQDEEEQSSRNFILDRAEFIDSVVVSGAYVWACCGIGLLLLVPIFLLTLEIRGRSKIRR